MSRSQNEIIAEIKNLCLQYKAEVPGHNQAWPKSIKIRVAELHALGLGDSEVASHVPIPHQTIYSWRHVARKKNPKTQSFVPVKVLSAPSTVTVNEKLAVEKSSTVAVKTSGFIIGGLSVDQIFELITKFEARS